MLVCNVETSTAELATLPPVELRRASLTKTQVPANTLWGDMRQTQKIQNYISQICQILVQNEVKQVLKQVFAFSINIYWLYSRTRTY